MADYVDGLVIEVEANASEAVDQLARLEERLASLKRATNKSGTIATYADHITKLNQAINGMDVISAEKISNLVHFTEAMTGLQSVKFSSTMSTNIGKLAETMRGIDGEVLSKLKEFSEATKFLADMKGFSYPSGLNKGLKNTIAIINELDTVNIAKFKEFTGAIAQLGQLSGFKGTDLSSMATSMKRLSSETHKATQRGRTFNTVLANIRVNTVMLLGVWHKVNRLVTSSLAEYGDYIETLNLFQVSMDETGGAMYEFAEKAQNLLGIDLTQWMKAQGVFMSLGKGFGIATERASVMSQQLTQLAYDISSFYNISVADAVQKVQSAFSGELEPVRRLGFDLSQARLQTIALSMGIDKNVSSMTQAEKANLRYIALLTQVTDLQGDLARTIESPTNQMRILNAQFQQMQRSIGLLLLPMLNKVLPYLNAILRVIKMIAEEIASMFGYTLPKLSGSGDFGMGIIDGGEDMADVLEEANGKANELKNTLASFDEINLITSSKSGGGVGDALQDLSSAWEYDLPTYDFLGDATENKAKQIAEDMMRYLEKPISFIKGAIKFVIDNLDEIETAIIIIAGAGVLGKLVTGFKNLLTDADTLGSKLAGFQTMVVGWTLSYIGGKDIGKGDFLKGAIEGTLGLAVSAIGGKLAFGTAGAVVSLGIGLFFLFTGIETGRLEKLKEEIDGVFFGFREDRQSVEEFQGAWENFTQSLTNSDLNPFLEDSMHMSDQIDTLGDKIANLDTAYDEGLIDADKYVQGMTELYSQMSEDIMGYFVNAQETILKSMEGTYGASMLMQGYTMQDVTDALSRMRENYDVYLSEYNEKLQEIANTYKQNGDIEAYRQALADLNKEYGITQAQTELSDQAIQDFNDNMRKVNFENWDEYKTTLDSLTKNYQEAVGQLENEYNGLVEAWETQRLGAVSQEDFAMIEAGLTSTEESYQKGLASLQEEYLKYIGVLEESAISSWDDVLNSHGFENAYMIEKEGLIELNEAIDKTLDAKQIERKRSDFTELIGIFGEYGDAVEEMFKNSSRMWEVDSNDSTKARRELIAQFEQRAKAIAITREAEGAEENYWKTVAKSADEGTDKWFKAEKNYWDGVADFTHEGAGKWIEYADKASGQIKKVTDASDESAKHIGSSDGKYGLYGMLAGLPAVTAKNLDYTIDSFKLSAPKFEKATSNIVKSIISNFSDPTEFKRTAMSLMDEIQKAFSDPDGVLGRTFQNTIDAVTDINPAIMRDKGTELKDNLLAGLTGSAGVEEATGSFKDMLFGGLDGNEAENFGRKLGQGIADGLDGTSGETEQAVKSVIKGMSAPFNQFGSDLYDFMTGLTEGVAEIWNGLTISTGKASFYNNGVRRWKMRGYASGGFPDSADFFYANENGVPEYIGSMGGRTAVANNTEIIDGVSDGVYRALRDSGIITDVKKIASKDGKVVFAPSEDAGRVMKQSVNMYNSTGGRY